MTRLLAFPAIALFALLSACTEGSDLERALIGGAIGCAAGEILRDGRCVAGAAVGAAAGALADDV